jgi:hypothetical protein
MADIKPLKLEFDDNGDPSGIAEFQSGDTIEGAIVDLSVSELTDVSSTLSPSTGDNLVWNGSLWTASADGGGGGGVTDHGLLTGLSHDDHPQYVLSATNNQLSSNVSNHIASASVHFLATEVSLSGLSDTSSSISPTTGDNLVWNGTNWSASSESELAETTTQPSAIDHLYGNDGGTFKKIELSALNAFVWARSSVDGTQTTSQYWGSGTGDLTVNESGFPNASSTLYNDGYVEIPYDGIYLIYAKIGLNVTVSPTTISLMILTTTGWGGVEGSTLAMGTQVIRTNIDPHQGVVDYIGSFTAGTKVAVKLLANASNTVKPERYASVRFQRIG